MLGALALAAVAFRLLAPPSFGSPWLLGGLALLALAWVALAKAHCASLDRGESSP